MRLYLIFTSLVLAITSPVMASMPNPIRMIEVDTAQALHTALMGARGGDHIILSNEAIYSAKALTGQGMSIWFHMTNDPAYPATEAAPIVIRATNEPLLADNAPTLTSSLVIEGNHVIVHRLHFTGDEFFSNIGEKREAALEIYAGEEGTSGKDVTIQGCWFKDIDVENGIRVGDLCHRALIQYCYFKDRLTGSQEDTVSQYISDDADGDYPESHSAAENVHIRYCHFETTHPQSTGCSTIRVGRREDDSIRYTNWLIEYCLLVEQNGNEMIEVKSCGNIFRYLTFINCDAKAQFRWGDDNKFQGFWMENTYGIFLRGQRNEVNGVKFLKGDATRDQYLRVWAGSVRAHELLLKDSMFGYTRANRYYAIPFEGGFVGQDKSKHPNAQDCFIFNFETDTPGSLEIGSFDGYELVETVGYPPGNITIEGIDCASADPFGADCWAISYQPGYVLDDSVTVYGELSEGRETYTPIKLTPADVGPDAASFTGIQQAISAETREPVSLDGTMEEGYSVPYIMDSFHPADSTSAQDNFHAEWRVLHDKQYIYFHAAVSDDAFTFINMDASPDTASYDGLTLAFSATPSLIGEDNEITYLHLFPTSENSIRAGFLNSLDMAEGIEFTPSDSIEGTVVLKESGWNVEFKIRNSDFLLPTLDSSTIAIDWLVWNSTKNGPDFLAWNMFPPDQMSPGNWGRLSFQGNKWVLIPEVESESILLDLIPEEAYGEIQDIDRFSGTAAPAEDDLSGFWRAANDGKYLYFYVEIGDKDKGVFPQSSSDLNPSGSDALLLAIDGDNSKGNGQVGSVDYADDWQIDIAAQADGGLLAWGRSSTNPDGGSPDRVTNDPSIEGISETSRSGYRMEFRVPMFPFGIIPSKGQEIGIDIRLSDYDGQSIPVEYAAWNSRNIFIDNPAGWGTAELESDAILISPFEGVQLKSEPFWLYSRWFGWYSSSGDSPWYYSFRNGWVYTTSLSSDLLNIYVVNSAKWYLTKSLLYPWAYEYATDTWLKL